MTITNSSLIKPQGPIAPEMFPGSGKLAIRDIVDAYIAQAYALARVAAITDLAQRDVAARAWVLYLTFSDVYTRMLTTPSQLTATDKGSHAYTDAQRDAIKDLRDSYLAAFDAAVDTTVAESATQQTTSVPTKFTW